MGRMHHLSTLAELKAGTCHVDDLAKCMELGDQSLGGLQILRFLDLCQREQQRSLHG